jgi:hypothetical protein
MKMLSIGLIIVVCFLGLFRELRVVAGLLANCCKNASSAQIEQFTEDKIDQVVKKIEEVLAQVPAGHAVHTSITSDPSKQTAFLNQIRTDALARARATPVSYPP